MENKLTLVLGASENEERYSHQAVKQLLANGHSVVAIGSKAGSIATTEIVTTWPLDKQPHTITIYLSPSLQKNYYEKILTTKPKRIIFNPGTENPELATLATQHGIETTAACTLVLLSTYQF